MAFLGTEFVLDDVPSNIHGLFISNMNGGDLDFVPASSSVELFTDRVYRKSRDYYYGASQAPPLEFNLEFTSPDELDSRKATVIKKWLFGRMQRKKLQIVQGDFSDIYFYCHLLDPEEIKVGNKIHGFSCRVSCDSPFAWEYERTLTKNYTAEEIGDSFVFYNDSDDDDYLYPSMTFTMNTTGGSFSITNSDDSSRQFLFTGLSPNEVITIDNRRNILTSSTGLRRLSTFNKNWMRFVAGKNSLALTGNISQVVFTYQFARKVGT